MIPDDHLNRQLARFSTLAGFDAVLKDPREHKRNMKKADTIEEIQRAFDLLIDEGRRHFCPSPAEIGAMIERLQEAEEQQAANERARAGAECYRCQGKGFFRTSLDDSGMQIPCSCARGRRWAELHPDLVAVFESACDAAEKQNAARVPKPRRVRQPGKMVRASQILGKDLR